MIMNNRTIYLLLVVTFIAIFFIEKELLHKTSEPAIGLNSNDPLDKVLSDLNYQLEDPSLAPDPIKKLVLDGFDLMVHTDIRLPNNVRGNLTCANCHFAGGNVTERKNGGLSLVGVAALYPRYKDRMGKVITLAERIQACFEKSMNGKAIAADSPEMLSFLTYLTWISKDIPIYNPVAWLEIKPLKSLYEGDVSKGKKLYEFYCADCHKSDGQGQLTEIKNYPPLWGEKSFNKKAGMAEPKIFASFIYYNMPYKQAELTEEQAIDITSYVLNQVRVE